MPFTILRQDITKMDVDAIVNAANTDLRMGGGVCGAIFDASGPEDMANACHALAPIHTGEAVITPGFKLKARHVIHTAGPIYEDGRHHEKEQLESCYRNSMALAVHHGLNSIAFPLISSGIYGYPTDQALQVALDTIKLFLENHDLHVYLAIYDNQSFDVSTRILGKVDSFIEANLIQDDRHRQSNLKYMYREAESYQSNRQPETVQSLDHWIDHVDASFSSTLLKLIDQKGKTDVEVYKKANLDRKLFSKIRSNDAYQPSKATALALAIGLELSLDETEALLEKAGYALSHSSKTDLIVEYFIRLKHYDIYHINEVLFKYDQAVLGSLIDVA